MMCKLAVLGMLVIALVVIYYIDMIISANDEQPSSKEDLVNYSSCCRAEFHLPRIGGNRLLADTCKWLPENIRCIRRCIMARDGSFRSDEDSFITNLAVDADIDLWLDDREMFLRNACRRFQPDATQGIVSRSTTMKATWVASSSTNPPTTEASTVVNPSSASSITNDNGMNQIIMNGTQWNVTHVLENPQQFMDELLTLVGQVMSQQVQAGSNLLNNSVNSGNSIGISRQDNNSSTMKRMITAQEFKKHLSQINARGKVLRRDYTVHSSQSSGDHLQRSLDKVKMNKRMMTSDDLMIMKSDVIPVMNCVRIQLNSSELDVIRMFRKSHYFQNIAIYDFSF